MEQTDLFVRNESFKEIDREILRPEDWRVAKTGKWQHTHEHITLKEGRVLTLLARRLSRARKFETRRCWFSLTTWLWPSASGKVGVAIMIC